MKALEIQASVTVIITDEIGEAFRQAKPNVALYVGGMGHKNKNFHNDAMVRRGYPGAAKAIQELYLEGRKGEAMEAVPERVPRRAVVGGSRRMDQGALQGLGGQRRDGSHGPQ